MSLTGAFGRFREVLQRSHDGAPAADVSTTHGSAPRCELGQSETADLLMNMLVVAVGRAVDGAVVLRLRALDGPLAQVEAEVVSPTGWPAVGSGAHLLVAVAYRYGAGGVLEKADLLRCVRVTEVGR